MIKINIEVMTFDTEQFFGGKLPDSIIGFSRSSGESIRLYVDEKKYQAGTISKIFYTESGTLTTDICVIQPPKLHRFTAQERPLRPGMSIGVSYQETGTATLSVRCMDDLDPASRYLLSCEHVLYANFSNDGRLVEQPAPEDQLLGTALTTVASVTKKCGLRMDSVNEVDAAIAKLNAGMSMSNLPLGALTPIRSITNRFGIGDRVVMYGRSSGVTYGRITDVNLSLRLQYGATRRTLIFQNIIMTDYSCAPGDSGAPVLLVSTGELIGLHMAGGVSGDVGPGYFCRIDTVFNKLNIGLP